MVPGLKIIQVQDRMALALTELALASKRTWGYPERWINAWRAELAITPELLRSSEAYGAWCGEELTGFYLLSIQDFVGQLDHLWVLPSGAGKGIGKALFSHAAMRARVRACKFIQLESDPNAEGF
jgi:GNAT superfamily N-acetyltransferase